MRNDDDCAPNILTKRNDGAWKTMNDDATKKSDDDLKNCDGGGALTSYAPSCGNDHLNYCVGSSLINTPFTKYL